MNTAEKVFVGKNPVNGRIHYHIIESNTGYTLCEDGGFHPACLCNGGEMEFNQYNISEELIDAQKRIEQFQLNREDFYWQYIPDEYLLHTRWFGD